MDTNLVIGVTGILLTGIGIIVAFIQLRRTPEIVKEARPFWFFRNRLLQITLVEGAEYEFILYSDITEEVVLFEQTIQDERKRYIDKTAFAITSQQDASAKVLLMEEALQTLENTTNTSRSKAQEIQLAPQFSRPDPKLVLRLYIINRDTKSVTITRIWCKEAKHTNLSLEFGSGALRDIKRRIIKDHITLEQRSYCFLQLVCNGSFHEIGNENASQLAGRFRKAFGLAKKQCVPTRLIVEYVNGEGKHNQKSLQINVSLQPLQHQYVDFWNSSPDLAEYVHLSTNNLIAYKPQIVDEKTGRIKK